MHSFITFGAIALALSGLSFAANITVYQPNEPFAPQTLPPPNPASKSDQIVQIFSTLGRTTVWNLVQKTPFQYDTGEPEGMVRLGTDRYFVSAGTYSTPTVSYGNNTIINGTDRTDGAGFAHLIVFDSNGTRIADATLTHLALLNITTAELITMGNSSGRQLLNIVPTQLPISSKLTLALSSTPLCSTQMITLEALSTILKRMKLSLSTGDLEIRPSGSSIQVSTRVRFQHLKRSTETQASTSTIKTVNSLVIRRRTTTVES